ncbi:MAG: outer membrane protein assembly factor BamA [Calditerrivibrio sp.]|nr:outer membrane protein assembly factor BamA [Calditerrivibrio sp.]
MKRFLAVLGLLLFLGSVHAGTIDKVLIQGNKRVSESKIQTFLPKAGEELDLKKIDDSIKKMYESGLFLDIKVDLRFDEDKMVLIYVVKEKPFVNKVYFEGNKEIKEDKLKEELKIKDNSPFDKKLIEDSVKQIRKKYEDNNFFNVKISYDIEERGNNAVDIVFTIDEGVESKIYTINFYGNKAFKEKELRKLIETNEKGFFSWLTGSGKIKRENLEIDRERIRQHYLNNGFMRVKVGEPELIYSEDKKKVTLNFRIEEGEKYKIGEISFKGNVHIDNKTLMDKLSLKKGDLFSAEKFQKDIAALTDAFTEIGYAFANVDPVNDIKDDEKIVNITYNIEENILYHINRIIISGNNKTRDRVIRREFDIVEGEKYNSIKIRDSKRHVEFTNYFEEVNLKEDVVADGLIDLKLSVKEKPTGMFTVGAGYSSLDGFTAMASVNQANLFGLGYNLGLKAEFSEKRTDYTLSFTDPWLFDRPITAGVDLYNLKRSYYEYTKKSEGIAFRLGHPIIKRKLYINYRLAYDKIKIYDIDVNASEYIKAQEGDTVTVSFTPSIVWNTLNHPFDPSKGNKSSLYIKYAGGLLGGDNEFVKTGLESNQYFPLFWSFVGMVRGELGYLTPLGGKELPIDERYRLGGMYSVRGYKYGDISPRDKDGYAYGGDKYLLFNAELSFDISKENKFKGVFFFDAGQVYDKGEAYLSKDFVKTVGYGFRWFSPIGPLRIEYGHKLDRKPGEAPGRWDFSIGGLF